MQRDVIFALVQPNTKSLTLHLIDPDGQVITADMLPESVTYEESVGISTTQQIFAVSQAIPGDWKAKVIGDTVDKGFFVVQRANVPPALFTEATATPAAQPHQVDVAWRLYAEEPIEAVNLYATAGAITDTFEITETLANGRATTVTEVRPLFQGIPIAAVLASTRDGSITSHTLDLGQLPSGDYAIWVETVNGEGIQVKTFLHQGGEVARITVDHANTFPLEWTTPITTEVDVKAGELLAIWNVHQHPDIDGYLIKVETVDPLAPSVPITYVTHLGDVGYSAVGSTIVDMIEPGWSYTLTVGAVDYDADRQVWSQSQTVAVPQPDFAISVPDGSYAISAGGPGMDVPLSIELSENLPHPVVVRVDHEQVSGGLYATPSADVVTTTTTSGALSVLVSASDSMPEGFYTIPVLARSGILEHQVNVHVQVKAREPDEGTGSICLSSNGRTSGCIRTRAYGFEDSTPSKRTEKAQTA